MDWEASLALIIQYTDENLQREFEHASTSQLADGVTHPETPVHNAIEIDSNYLILCRILVSHKARMFQHEKWIPIRVAPS